MNTKRLWLLFRFSMSLFILVYISLYFFAVLPSYVNAQTGLTISGITDNRTTYSGSQIPKYEKFEITFQVNNSVAQNVAYPFDSSPPPGITPGIGISVNALFSKDNWQTFNTQPAFYFQDFLWEQRQNADWAYPTGNNSWKVRFAPPTTGSWKFKLVATDGSGSIETPESSFTVTQSSSHGFIRVSPTDSRYFQFDDGTYFPALGFNFNANQQDIESNLTKLQNMRQNGIQLGRTWLSSWSIWGSQWNPWYAMPNNYDGYLPRAGLEAFDNDFRLKMVYRATNPSDPSCNDNCSYWKATRFLGWMNPKTAVKPNPNTMGPDYRIRVKYRAQNITGPRITTSSSFGLVAKISNSWLDGSSPAQPAAHNPGSGMVVTNYGGNTSSWQEISGPWESSSNNFLPFFYLTLENVIDPGANQSAGVAYVDEVVIEEVLNNCLYLSGNPNNCQFGSNILNKPKMNQLTYFDQRYSYAFDKLLQMAEDNDVYLRPVILEKQEYLQNHIDYLGVKRTDDPLPPSSPNFDPNFPGSIFYGNGRTPTAGSWLQKAYYRYLQARWGYSTAIHSWELVNEGDPALTQHYVMTDELGKYMRQFSPNHHMVSTSNWHSFPASSWANQPNIDFADVHAYISTGAWLYGSNTTLRDNMVVDAAKYHLEYSNATRNLIDNLRQVPIIRGEAGIDMYNLNGSNQNEQPDLALDTNGTWLHNYLWAGLSSGGLIESYWWTNNIHTRVGPDGQTGLYEIYKYFSDFVTNIPLNNGHYQAINLTDTATHRFTGQIDPINNRAHLWVQNLNHTWRKVVDNTAQIGLPSTVSLNGFTGSASNVPVEYFLFSNTGILTRQNSTVTITNGSATITLPNPQAYADIGIKIGNYASTPQPSPTPPTHCQPLGDIDCTGKINVLDFGYLFKYWGSSNQQADLNDSGTVDNNDIILLLTNIL